MRFEMRFVRGHVEVYDGEGRFLFSADNEREAEEDLALLWEASLNMFENDHSAARGKMAVRELIIFKHDSELGCAPAWKLFDTVSVKRKIADGSPARAYSDYTVTVDEAALPAGVTLKRLG